MTIAEWAKQIKLRDGYICQICGADGNFAHHIRAVGYSREYATQLDNGITLCRKCHTLAHRNFAGAIGNKYDYTTATQALNDRLQDKSKLPIVHRLIVSDILNTVAAYKERKAFDLAEIEISRLCKTLNCQPGDILEYTEKDRE